MQVDLRDRTALVLGAGPVAEAVANRLREAGATMPSDSGPLDILVHVLPAAVSSSLATQLDRIGWATALLDTVGPAAVAAREAIARMPPGGRVVFVTDAFGVVPSRLRAAAASASAALAAYARALATEQGPRGILVNVVACGPSDAPDDARLLSHVPLGRPAGPEDAAHTALFLCAPASAYVTGHVLVVDGGWSAGFARDF